VAQAGCAIRLVAGFLERLKSLGRYDAATIVVHADTGHGLGFVDGADGAAPATTLGRSNEVLLSSVNALLMIKRPHATGPLQIVAAPSQLADLLPTLVEVLELAPPDYELRGKSLYPIDGRDARAAAFGFDPEQKHGPNLVQVRIEDQMDLENSALTVLGPAVDPHTWRAGLQR
jgi:arylsulfatase A-like enzyme